MRRPPSWSITRQYDGCEPLSYQRAKNVPLVRGADQKNTKKARPCHASPRPRYRGIVPYQTTATIEGLVPCRAALTGPMSANGMVRRAPARQQAKLARGAKDKEHAMSSRQPITAIAVIGIDIGKNSFHVVGHDARGAIVLRQSGRVAKWKRCSPIYRLA